MKLYLLDNPLKYLFQSFEFVYTEKDNLNKLFKHGCDYIVKYFDESFKESFEKAEKLINVALEN